MFSISGWTSVYFYAMCIHQTPICPFWNVIITRVIKIAWSHQRCCLHVIYGYHSPCLIIDSFNYIPQDLTECDGALHCSHWICTEMVSGGFFWDCEPAVEPKVLMDGIGLSSSDDCVRPSEAVMRCRSASWAFGPSNELSIALQRRCLGRPLICLAFWSVQS